MPKRKKYKRPSKDEYFLQLARLVSVRSTCLRLRVGSVLVKDNMIISTGYNGAPRGLEHCDDVGCRVVSGHDTRTVHSELNTLLQAAYHGVSTKGSTLYTIYLPCERCTRAIINGGIVRVVYGELYKNIDQPHVKSLFRKAKVRLVKLGRAAKK